MTESKKALLMRKLGCSAEEADDIIKNDDIIDHGGRTQYDLTPEQEKAAKKYAHAGERKKPLVFDSKPRERKANPTKGGIIAELFEFLSKSSDFAVKNAEITNKERQIAFQIGEESFELTLVQKRKPKK